MEESIKTFFVVLTSSHCGWSSGNGPEPEFMFISATTPEAALNEAWKSKVESFFDSRDYSMKVYTSAEAYHKNEKSLAKKYRLGEDPFPCDQS